MRKLKVALVYDRINKSGGAERVLESLHSVWPDAPVYTAVYDPHRAAWAHGLRVIPTFLQHIPFARHHHEWFAWLTPLAFETFSFDGYDVVISVTSAEAKNILTKPETMHICYCLTPTRYLWSGADVYSRYPNIGLPAWLTSFVYTHVLETLRRWDTVAAKRPDTYIAISKLVAQRIRTYYGIIPHSVIYPPVDTQFFAVPRLDKTGRKEDGYYIVVSRLVGYKRTDIVVDAFNRLGWPLVIVGDGSEKKTLVRKAGKNIRFTGAVSDEKLQELYAGAKAFVYAGQEDFGIVAVEALASGIPVIAYRDSGISEFVRPGITGELFDSQTADSLVEALEKSRYRWYDSASCAGDAEKFSSRRFEGEIREVVESLYAAYRKNE